MEPERGIPLRVESTEAFMLVGPIEDIESKHERILLQSRTAPLELLGFVRSTELGADYGPSGSIDYRVGPERSTGDYSDPNAIGLVRSSKVRPPTSQQIRPSTYTLVWRGRVASGSEDRIQRALDRNLPDILNALARGNSADVEWSFSEIAHELYRALSIERRRQERRSELRRLLLTAYLAAVSLASIIAVIYLLR